MTDEDAKRLKSIERDDLIFKGDNGILRMKTEKAGTCCALRDGRCEIYEARPSICRAYPLYFDLFVGLCALKECPAFSKKNTTFEKDLKPAIVSLIDVYQFWIDTWKRKIADL